MKKSLIAAFTLSLMSPALAQDAALVFAALDANRDNRISQDEAQKNPAVNRLFAEADKNHDRFLSKEEFLAAFGK